MRLKVTMTKSEIQTAIQQYLVKAGLRIEDIDTIVNETGQTVCDVNPPVPYYATPEAMAEHSLNLNKILNCDPFVPSNLHQEDLHVIFVIDNSGSMSMHNYHDTVHAIVESILDRYANETDYRITPKFVPFTTEATVTFRQEDIYKGSPGGTNLSAGVDQAKDCINLEDKAIVYLITDDGGFDPKVVADIQLSLFHLTVLAPLVVFQFGEDMKCCDENKYAHLRDLIPDNTTHFVIEGVTPKNVCVVTHTMSLY